MPTLKRLLKPGTVRPILERALALAPRGTRLTVLDHGIPLLWTGDAAPDGPADVSLQLSCEGHPCGHLLVHLPPGALPEAAQAARNLATFLQCSLDALIISELGRRCIASETLDKALD